METSEPSGSSGGTTRKGKGIGKRSMQCFLEKKSIDLYNLQLYHLEENTKLAKHSAPVAEYEEQSILDQEPILTEDGEEINEIEITSDLGEYPLLVDLENVQDLISDDYKDINAIESMKFSDDSEMDAMDLSNSSPIPGGSSVRSSVIFCSKTITSISEESVSGKHKPTGEAVVKNVDTAKKKLFANDDIEPTASFSHTESLELSPERRFIIETDKSPSDENKINRENVIKCCNDGEDCAESQNGVNYCIRRSRKRSLTKPNFMLTKKICSSNMEAPILDNTPPAEPISEPVNTSAPPDLAQWLDVYDSWSSAQKNVALDALIKRSTMYQLRHMMKTIEPLFQTDFISLLPKELALIVLGYLEPNDLSKVAQTCRYWRFLANDNLLWKKLCHRVGITSVGRSKFFLYRPVSSSPWKWAYVNQHMIENNWRTKPSSEAIIMRGHDDHVITCLQVYGDKIVSGSDDTTLKVWSMVTGECLQTLVGHAGGVWSCQMIDDLVVSGSTDRTLRVWDAVTGRCLSVLGGHTSTVRCMKLHKNKVVSGSRDTTLRLWLLPQGRCLQVLVGHMAAVRCVQYDGKLVISGAYDYSVKIWNPDTGECLHTLIGHTNRVYTLKYDGVHLLSGSLDTTIRVWDPTTGQCKHTLIGHTSLITSMELQKNILVSGNADATLKIWDITKGECLHTLAGPKKHTMSVTYVQLLKRFVVSSSDDGTVKLWDRKTGDFIRNILELASGGAGGNVLRIRADNTQLVCAVGSRNGTEETKLMLMKFDRPHLCDSCNVIYDQSVFPGQSRGCLLNM